MLRQLHFVTIMLLLLNPLALFSSSYDSDILNVFSKLMPRFVLMSSLQEHIESSINICLLHENKDKLTASSLQDMIYKNYPEGIKGYEIFVRMSSYSTTTECQDSQLIFLFDTDLVSIEKFRGEKKLIVSYSPVFLEKRSDISLFVGRRVVPYLNVNHLHKKGIKLDNILYRISKIYKSKEQ